MKRHFTLPVVIATALHVALLFGFSPAPRPVVVAEAPSGGPGLPPIPVTIHDDPIVGDDELDGVESRPRKGNPDDAAPEGPDVSKPTPSSFTMTKIDVPGRAKPGAVTIPGGPPGVPDGDPDGNPLGHIGPVDFSQLDNPPRARAQPAPMYPAEARHRGWEGEVVVSFTVDEAGRVSALRVVRMTDAAFEAAALKAVALWRFEPGRRHGKPVSYRMAVPVVFRINP
jgi:protein TonB